jgi:hypothetical protein
MANNRKDTALRSVLNTAFDVTYMALLEADQISLDDELQCRLRETIVSEVYGVLWAECERMTLSGEEIRQYFCAQGHREVSRRLKQELQQEEIMGALSPEVAARLVLLPAFEVIEG